MQSDLLAFRKQIFKNKAPELQSESSAQPNTNSRYHNMPSAGCSNFIFNWKGYVVKHNYVN